MVWGGGGSPGLQGLWGEVLEAFRMQEGKGHSSVHSV